MNPGYIQSARKVTGPEGDRNGQDVSWLYGEFLGLASMRNVCPFRSRTWQGGSSGKSENGEHHDTAAKTHAESAHGARSNPSNRCEEFQSTARLWPMTNATGSSSGQWLDFPVREFTQRRKGAKPQREKRRAEHARERDCHDRSGCRLRYSHLRLTTTRLGLVINLPG